MILGTPILGEKQHTTADKSPVPGEHQAGKLRAQPHRTHSFLPDGSQHDRIHHTARRGKQILERHRHRNDGDVLQKVAPVKFVVIHL